MSQPTGRPRAVSVAYSPLRYPGGKARLGAFLAEIVRCTTPRPLEYIEPYAGGAGAALRLLFEEYVDSIAINDADPRIYAFWRAAVENNDRFIDCLQGVKIDVREWRRQREIYDRCDLRKSFELGFATFYLNRTSHSGIIHNGGPIGGFEQKGPYKIDARFPRTELTRRLSRIGTYSERISLSSTDGRRLLISLAKRRNRAKQALVYLDPPYFNKGPDLYLNRLSVEEHAALGKYLLTARPFAWIMTYDDTEAVRELFRTMRTVSFSLSYSAYERRNGSELLIFPPTIEIPASALALLPRLPLSKCRA